MESSVETRSGSAASSMLQNYASRTKALHLTELVGCAAFITLACISLITISTSLHPSLFKGSFSPDIRSLLGMLRVPYHEDDDGDAEYKSRVRQVLEKASMPNRTVILTTLNGAWANEGAMVNLFLESFWIGRGTQRLLQHLIFVCVDDKAYERCLVLHPHCLRIKTSGIDLSQEQILLTENYIQLVWRRIKFLKEVLMMDFNFVFTDTDILWLRDPFPLLQDNRGVDFQIASDRYNKKPWDIHNQPNSGFIYVRANRRTVNFFDYWHRERKRDTRLATQGIFNIIKFDKEFKNIGMILHFLDPQLFGGFCTIQDTNMAKAITLHATCCKGLEAKLIDLRKILEGWKTWQQLHKLDPQSFLHEIFLNNQSVLSPCTTQRLHINPQFDKPFACIQSLKN